jgi:peptidoglycan/xylan/chitin deacetylase (PgdA/CDA1 family)
VISVAAREEDQETVREFFELFKTRWQFYQDDATSEVLLCTRSSVPKTSAKLVLLYGAGIFEDFDRANGVENAPRLQGSVVRSQNERFPIYGFCRVFPSFKNGLLIEEGKNDCAAFESEQEGQITIRIGFDLFDEVRYLLERGQPADKAAIPTLDLHIAFLREVLLNHFIPVVEIPPIPGGYSFTACLTHDVDHAGVKYHKWDRSLIGFLFRAIFLSPIDFFHGRKRAAQVMANWKAALTLPMVYLGWAKDFWNEFAAYLEIENGIPATFFFIPFQNDSGLDVNGRRQARRAARYHLDDLADEMKKLSAAGKEIAVHGIDAWRDSKKGRAEREAMQSYANAAESGIRMHWLFFSPDSAAVLEAAGYSYDATTGYNETIGYRAGTSQVFKPPASRRLLELPLHIMDTALFFPSYLHLTEEQAGLLTAELIKNTRRHGGVLTINWHVRSLGPERLWDQPYRRLVGLLRETNVWFATAAEAVAWFRKRRAIAIDAIGREGENLRIKLSLGEQDDLPPVQIRVYRPGPRDPAESRQFADFLLGENAELLVAA